MLTGQNGILNRTAEAKEKTEAAQKDEEKTLQGYEDIIAQYTGSLPLREETKPYFPNSTFSYKEGDLSTGLVIKDSSDNEYVWVEVPKSIYTNSNYNVNGEPSSSTDYEKIEKCLKLYAKDYSDPNFSDTNPVYLEMYKNMLKSVYENGGFWIGRYEVGLEEGKSLRAGYVAIKEDDKAVMKPNMIPYNYVTRDDAQKLATRMNYNGCTSSLIFGIQWDLTLKYIENKKINKDTSIKGKLISNGKSIGNFCDSEIVLNRGKFAQVLLSTKWYSFNSEEMPNIVTGSKKNPQEQGKNVIMMTTGASEATNLQQIYDIAGNLWEWTLEYKNADAPCVGRGNGFSNRSSDSAVARGDVSNTHNDYHTRLPYWSMEIIRIIKTKNIQEINFLGYFYFLQKNIVFFDNL